MVVSKINFAVILLLASLAGGAWGAHEAFMHHWPIVHTKFPGLSDWWNPAVSWTFKYRFPWWYPVQITDGKHLLFTIHGLCIAATFWIMREQILWLSRPWPKGYILYLGGVFVSYTIGNILTYNVIFG